MISELTAAIEHYIQLLRAKGYYVTVCFRTPNAFGPLLAKYNIHYHPFCLALKSNPQAWDQCILRQQNVYKKLTDGAFFGMCHAGVEEFVFPIMTAGKPSKDAHPQNSVHATDVPANDAAGANNITHANSIARAQTLGHKEAMNRPSNCACANSTDHTPHAERLHQTTAPCWHHNENEMIGFVSVSGFRTAPQDAKKRINRVSSEYLIAKEKLAGLYQKLSPVLPAFDLLKGEIEPLCFMVSYLHALTCSATSLDSERSLYSRILMYIDRHFADGITLGDISRHCYCSLSAVSHVFAKHQGMPVMKYVQTKRLNEAKTLLLESDFSIKTISEMTGFSDSNYFITCFKKAFGIPPATFRRQFQKPV